MNRVGIRKRYSLLYEFIGRCIWEDNSWRKTFCLFGSHYISYFRTQNTLSYAFLPYV